MSVKFKTILISFISCIFIIIVTSSIFNLIISRYSNKVEKENIENLFQIVQSILKIEEANMEKTAIDWAHWDATYNFLLNKDKNYIDYNFQDNTIKQLGLNLMFFIDTEGNIIYSKTYNLENQTVKLVQQKLFGNFNKVINFKKDLNKNSGIMIVSGKVFIITASDITTSDERAKSNGVLIIGKYVDEPLLKHMNTVTNSKVNFEEIINFTKINSKVLINGNQIIGHEQLKDILGETSVLSSIDTKSIMNNYKIYYFKVFIIIFSIIVIIVTFIDVFIKDRLILKRLSKLCEFIENVAVTKDITNRIEMHGDDEIYEIANATNKMLSELDLLYKDILFLSYSDKLTGLKNRAYIEDKFEELDSQNNINYSIIMGDLNGLKITNDAFGHSEGDRLLYTMANILKNVCLEDDIIGRWSGDEFIILVINKETSYVVNLIESIKNECAKVNDFTFNLSIALGSVEKSEIIDGNVEMALGVAEERMYRNKLTEIRSLRSSVISSLLKTLNENHAETEEHTQRIKKLSMKLGKKLGLSQAKLDELDLLSVLHDIGKVGIPGHILMKKGKLTNEEWEIMKSHTAIGYRIAKSAPRLAHVADGILCHHEKFDGTGYPSGFKGNEIPLLSRIINIVDSFDVITNARCYKEAASVEHAIEELKRCSGTQFDSEIVQVFIKLLVEEKIYLIE